MWDGGSTMAANDDTTQLADAADRLRAVRRAHERFLALWAVDHLLADAAAGLGADLTAGVDAGRTPDNHDAGRPAGRPLFWDRPLDD